MGVVLNQVASVQKDGSGGVNVGTAERLASVILGGAMVAAGVARRSWTGLSMALIGGSVAHRGVTGRSRLYALLGMRTRSGSDVELQQSITLQRPRGEVYRFCRDFENHPHFMHRVESVQPLPDGTTRWRVRGLRGHPVEWTAVVTREQPGELIAWRTVEPGPIVHSGELRFQDAPGGRGTEVQIHMRYRAAGGRAGVVLARLLGEEPSQVLAEELRRLRQLLETGEIATIAGQPASQRSLLGRALSARLGEEAR